MAGVPDREGGEQGELSLGIGRSGDAALIAGVRRGDAGALHEFCARFHPVLREQARTFRVSADERDAVVLEFLDDLAMKIVEGANPRTLAGFVVRSFRNHLIDRRRRERTSERQMDEHAESVGGERVLRMGCSDYTVLLTRGTGELLEDADTRSLMQELADALIERRAPEERELLVWMSNRVPLRHVASWLGISYAATKVRVFRLRKKLALEAEAHIQTLPEPQRTELSEILRRATLRQAQAERGRTV